MRCRGGPSGTITLRARRSCSTSSMGHWSRWPTPAGPRWRGPATRSRGSSGRGSLSTSYRTSARPASRSRWHWRRAEPGERVATLYGTYCAGGTEPSDALARAMAEDAIDRVGEAPIGSLIELGRRAGFLAPWSNQGRGGKLRKRYTATAEFLETLVAATVEPDDPAEFPEFLERLRDSFGVVMGRPEDDVVIRHTDLRDEEFWPSVVSINEDDLRRNVEEFRELLVECGYAKAYADGRTMVTTRPEGSILGGERPVSRGGARRPDRRGRASSPGRSRGARARRSGARPESTAALAGSTPRQGHGSADRVPA